MENLISKEAAEANKLQLINVVSFVSGLHGSFGFGFQKDGLHPPAPRGRHDSGFGLGCPVQRPGFLGHPGLGLQLSLDVQVS